MYLGQMYALPTATAGLSTEGHGMFKLKQLFKAIMDFVNIFENDCTMLLRLMG